MAWAYPEFRWDPLPVFQSYMAYTKRLDELDERRLRSHGPDFVLRVLDTPIDGRQFALEMPQTMLTMFCRYQPVSVAPTWQLLARRADRCGEPRAVGSVRARVGESFAVPAGSGEGLILADFHRLQTPLWQRLRTLLFRREPLYLWINDAALLRLVPDTARAPLIVEIPDTLDYPGSFALSIDAKSLRIVEGAGTESGPPLTVDFYEVPLTTPQG